MEQLKLQSTPKYTVKQASFNSRIRIVFRNYTFPYQYLKQLKGGYISKDKQIVRIKIPK